MSEVEESRAFGELVRAHRRRLGLTQEELATKAGLSVRSIVKIEGGRTAAPRPPTVRLLADVFGLTGADAEHFRRCAAGAAEPPAAPPRAGVPAQLPPDVSAFTGREEQLGALDAAADQATAVLVAVVTGPAGAGKTALAVRWAHRVRERFPDGQLYLNLRGSDPAQPMTAADALVRLLAALGVTGEEVPVDVDDRAARFRTEIADRRVLLLLDNASTAGQVRPLLPGTASSAVLVTSRDALAGLVAVDGAHRLAVGLLPPGDAHALLRRLIGPRAAAAEDAVARIAEQCARLPLALRVAAELAASRADTGLDDLAAELHDQRRRLDLLVVDDDPRASVRVVLSWSIRHLPPGVARTFALLGLHPGPDLDAHAAAALTGAALGPARGELELLARANLVHRTGPGRYGMHDLLRAYALELAPGGPQLDGLLDYYRAAAAAAMNVAYPTDAHHRPAVPPAAGPLPELADREAARAWLDRERAVLIAIVAGAAAAGRPGHAVDLARVLARHLGADPADAVTVHGHALDAALASGDRAGEAHSRNVLGVALLRLGRPAAVEVLERAVELFAAIGDPAGQARALNNLGYAASRQGRLPSAVASFEAALRLFRQVGDRTGAARTLNNLGLAEERQGRYAAAEQHHLEALALYRALGDPGGEAGALTDLGIAEHRLGRLDEAAEHHRQALSMFLDGLDRVGEAWARNGLGEAALALGNPAGAVDHHTAALDAATAAGVRDQQARAHRGLGEAHEALRDRASARTHRVLAATLYAELGMPEPA
ncbi:tetratricopeptide repeat protein [Dactylosporangium sucinum]|uniref:ATP-binding protein n=1 Tax=Dactylosporangium sucinum TaxID=1424081 RepID=UPI00167C5691|nr:tetratricopeptide repeat protein [Dactylosporangium sucinum]